MSNKRPITTSDAMQMLEQLGHKMGLVAEGNMFGFRYRIQTKYLLDFSFSDEFDIVQESTSEYSQVTHFKARRQEYRGRNSNQETSNDNRLFDRASTGGHKARKRHAPAGSDRRIRKADGGRARTR